MLLRLPTHVVNQSPYFEDNLELMNFTIRCINNPTKRNLANSLGLVNTWILDYGTSRDKRYYELVELQSWLMFAIREMYGDDLVLPTNLVTYVPFMGLKHKFKDLKLGSLASRVGTQVSPDIIQLIRTMIHPNNSKEEWILLNYMNDILESRGLQIEVLHEGYNFSCSSSRPSVQRKLELTLKALVPGWTDYEREILQANVLVTVAELTANGFGDQEALMRDPASSIIKLNDHPERGPP